MKLSIGIPTYNQAEYIEKAILSALNQPEPAYQVVLSNNHSTDSTAEVLEKYKDKIRIITPPKHLTMTENFNFLVKNLSGDWFSFISSDDFYEPDFVKVFNKNVRTDTVLMRFGFNRIDGMDNFIQKDIRIRTAKRIQSFPGNFYEQLTGPCLHFAAFAVKLSSFAHVGYFDERIEIDGDWGAWLRLAPEGKFHYVPKTVSNYRIYSRAGIVYSRLKRETLDAELICNSIQKSIIDKYNLHLSLWEQARRVLIKNKVIFHLQLKSSTEYIYELFNVSKEDIDSVSCWDRWLVYLRQKLFRF